jgi:hypothetical protein
MSQRVKTSARAENDHLRKKDNFLVFHKDGDINCIVFKVYRHQSWVLLWKKYVLNYSILRNLTLINFIT